MNKYENTTSILESYETDNAKSDKSIIFKNACKLHANVM